MQGRAGQPFTKDSCSPATPMNIVQEGWGEQIKTDPRVRYFDLVACQQVDLTSKIGGIRKTHVDSCRARRSEYASGTERIAPRGAFLEQNSQ